VKTTFNKAAGYYWSIFTNAALERITGINQRQIQHYASGAKRPRPQQLKKIETALRELGEELISVERRTLFQTYCDKKNCCHS